MPIFLFPGDLSFLGGCHSEVRQILRAELCAIYLLMSELRLCHKILRVNNA